MTDAGHAGRRSQGPRWLHLLPGVVTARRYDPGWFRSDITAGLVLITLLIPGSMAYAQASGLPPVNGLYTSIAALVVYAVVGPSRHLIYGPDSSLAPLIAASVVPISGGDPGRAVALASILALLTGLVCVVAALARFGFVTDLLSLPVRHGYMNGIALTIIVSQLPKLLGFSASGDTALKGLRSFWTGVVDGETDPTALVVGGSCLVAIILLRRWVPRLPGLLLVVVGAILATRFLDLDSLAVVGELPRGVPHLVVPDLDGADLGRLFAGALGIVIVAYAETSVLSRTFAGRAGERVDQNQELGALGLTNAAAGLLQGFPLCSSSSRTAVAESAGARTQLAGIIAALAIVVTLVWLPWVFQDLPSCALAAIVIASALTLIDVRDWMRWARVRRSELTISLVAFFGIAVLGVLRGLGLAVAVSLLNFVRKAWIPHTAELVRVEGLKGYHEAARHPEGHRIPGLVLYRFDAPLFFANADTFRKQVEEEARDGVRWVVVTAEPITDVDATAAEMLGELRHDLAKRGVLLAFAELKGHVRDQLQRFGLVDQIGAEHFYRTIGQAVHAYVDAEQVDWTDWEERS
jgi:high affinity sulfate transporter 1